MRLPPWLKKLLAGAAVALGVIALGVFLARAGFRRVGGRELERVTAEVDAADPGWRLADIQAARERAAPPADVNSIDIGQQVRTRLDPDWLKFGGTRDAVGALSNQWPGFWTTAWFLQAGTGSGDARDFARAAFLRPEVLARPGGFAPLRVKDNPFLILLPHAQDQREVCALLDVDARLAALEGRPDRGVAAARAALVAARGMGDEPFLISQLVRVAGGTIAAGGGMQVLAWGEPKAGLAEFQAELRAEADHPGLLVGLRGERAAVDKFFAGLEDGTIDTGEGLEILGVRRNPFAGVGLSLYKGFLPGDRAMSLRLLTASIEAAKKPPHEQKAAFAAIPDVKTETDGVRYLITRLVLPATQRVWTASIRYRATLLTASAAVACERFRQLRGRWPGSLAEIPPDILPPLPPDPYTGRPLQYRTVADGVLVFAAADDLNPNVNLNPDPRLAPDPLAGLGRGWKLWNPELRGVPAPAADPPPDLPFDPNGMPNP